MQNYRKFGFSPKFLTFSPAAKNGASFNPCKFNMLEIPLRVVRKMRE